MRSIVVSLGLVLAAATAQAAGTVQVSYVQPEKFADAANSGHDIDANLKELTRHFEALGARYLADGQKLSVEVLDIDLAGEVRPLHRVAQDIRVMKGRADWPRIKLRYTLDAPGQPARSGEQVVADMAYLQHSSNYASRDHLGHEKRMLDEWFAGQFGPASAK